MLGVVVPYWNPFADRNRLENLGRCLERLRAEPGVRVLCLEMASEAPSGMADIVLPGAPGSIYIWQKERLVNHGCAILAGEGVDHVGYVDGDCLFTDAGWAERILARFHGGRNFVQGFCHATNGVESVPAALASYPKLGYRLHGGSMFLHRDLFQSVGGLYEYCIVGGGDFVLMMAVTGDHSSLDWIFPGDDYRDHASRWLDGFRSVNVRPACADNVVAILSHGNPQRSHRMRHVLLQDFVPEQDILRGDTLGLTEIGMRLVPRLRAYTAHREDRADMIVRSDDDDPRDVSREPGPGTKP